MAKPIVTWRALIVLVCLAIIVATLADHCMIAVTAGDPKSGFLICGGRLP